jgi:preprotein translocase subunit SecA
LTTISSQLWRATGVAHLRPQAPRGLDALARRVVGLAARVTHRPARCLALARRVDALSPSLTSLTDADLRARALELRAIFRAARDTPHHTLAAFALVREAASRTLGLRHHLVQLAGGLALSRGAIAEMPTGEGKTLVATLHATIAGWRGRGCHVITVNDYLAHRDAQWMAPLYTFLSVSVAHITNTSTTDQRRAAYAADVTYLTNKEAAADFLRDRLALRGVRSLASALAASLAAPSAPPSSLVMRGLDTAIIDEADSVLIDEAGTPLIISSPPGPLDTSGLFEHARDIATALQSPRDFRVDHRHHDVTLTRPGLERALALAAPLGGLFAAPRRAEELITQALVAAHLFHKGRHYIIDRDRAVIVDDATGRLMPDRTWNLGLHQAIEAKERLPVRAPSDTLARISFQRFFRLYRRLSGMTATAREEAAELWQTYRLPVVVIPPNLPPRRRTLPQLTFATAPQKWAAAIDETLAMRARGRPVLIGARTIEQSQQLSNLLTQRGVPHSLLTATNHASEADIIAHAGEHARITIATNMAGRGTDIRLAPGVADLGGLHVISVERHDSPRIDRQLFGRAARQGDPGSARSIVSLDDPIIIAHGATHARRIAPLASSLGVVPPALAAAVFARAQSSARRLARLRRAAVLRADQGLDEALGFTPPGPSA